MTHSNPPPTLRLEAGECEWVSVQIWVDDRDTCVGSVMHEMGHYLDYCYDFISESETFIEIYEEEFEEFETIHHLGSKIDTSREYFAQSYRLCIEEPILMQSHCPQTYVFIMYYSERL